MELQASRVVGIFGGQGRRVRATKTLQLLSRDHTARLRILGACRTVVLRCYNHKSLEDIGWQLSGDNVSSSLISGSKCPLIVYLPQEGTIINHYCCPKAQVPNYWVHGPKTLNPIYIHTCMYIYIYTAISP